MKEEGNKKSSEKKVSWGEELAASAMSDAGEERTPEGENDEAFDRDVDGFISKCIEEEADPVEVVFRVAKNACVDLLGDPPSGPSRTGMCEEERRRVYTLLRAVLKRIVLSILACVVDKSGFGPHSLVGDIVRMLVMGVFDGRRRRDMPVEDDSVRQGDPEDSEDDRDSTVSIAPLSFGYAFSW